MSLAQIALVAATLLCAMVAGLLFAFAVVIMPGLAKLGDREYIRAFQEVDGVIQRGQPLFGLLWVGSAVAVLVGLALGMGQTAGLERGLLIAASGLYLLGVQLPTFSVNIPLNNALQAFQVAEADEAAVRSARSAFEARWNVWNTFRTAAATLSSAMLTVVLSVF